MLPHIRMTCNFSSSAMIKCHSVIQWDLRENALKTKESGLTKVEENYIFLSKEKCMVSKFIQEVAFLIICFSTKEPNDEHYSFSLHKRACIRLTE